MWWAAPPPYVHSSCHACLACQLTSAFVARQVVARRLKFPRRGLANVLPRSVARPVMSWSRFSTDESERARDRPGMRFSREECTLMSTQLDLPEWLGVPLRQIPPEYECTSTPTSIVQPAQSPSCGAATTEQCVSAPDFEACLHKSSGFKQFTISRGCPSAASTSPSGGAAPRSQ